MCFAGDTDLVYGLEVKLERLLCIRSRPRYYGQPAGWMGGQVATPAPAEPLPTAGQALKGFFQVSRVPVAACPSPELQSLV